MGPLCKWRHLAERPIANEFCRLNFIKYYVNRSRIMAANFSRTSLGFHSDYLELVSMAGFSKTRGFTSIEKFSTVM